MPRNESGGYVYHKGEWWRLLAEEPRDMCLITDGKREKRVSVRVLMEEIDGKLPKEKAA